jgi:DNA-binding PadR family transcriptional regulator
MGLPDVPSPSGHQEDRQGCGRVGRRHRHRHHGATPGCGREGRAAASVLDESDLRLVMIALLAEQPRNGFEMIRALEARVGGAYPSGPTVVYPNLMLLEEMGLIAGTTDPAGRKVYTLIDEGLTALAKNGLLVDAILADAAGADINLGTVPAAGRRHRRCRHGGTATGTVSQRNTT